MSWTLDHSVTDNLVRLTVAESVSTEDVTAQAMESIELIKRHESPGILVDYSGAILEMPVEEISKLPELFEALGLPRETRIAIVLPADPKNMHKYTFFDDVATNRGYRVGLHWEPTRAMAWLAEPTLPEPVSAAP